MSKLQKLQCDNCGGRIDGSTLVCQSCGMQYKLNDGPDGFTLGRVEVYHGKFQLVQGHVCVPAFTLEKPEDYERAAEWTLKDMANNMAQYLLPFMEFQSSFEPQSMTIDTYAQIRVAEPMRTANGRVIHQVAQDWYNVYKR